jgi:HEPN domain-containing protein
MIERISLLDRAKVDLKSCKMILENADADELFQDIAAFHIQQAIEKALKFWLSITGKEPPKTHDTHVLIENLENENQKMPVWLSDNADLINEFK